MEAAVGVRPSSTSLEVLTQWILKLACSSRRGSRSLEIVDGRGLPTLLLSGAVMRRHRLYDFITSQWKDSAHQRDFEAVTLLVMVSIISRGIVSV